MNKTALTRGDILRLFEALNKELRARKVTGELYLVGGAVMCLVHNQRPSTKDIDAAFAPTKEVRLAAKKVGEDFGLPADWLNDAVKGFLSERADFAPQLELDHLKVFCASAEYLLAMKCLAFRIGQEFHDETDVRYLLRYLNIETYAAALEVIARYYPLDRFPQKTLHALEELLPADRSGG